MKTPKKNEESQLVMSVRNFIESTNMHLEEGARQSDLMKERFNKEWSKWGKPLKIKTKK